MTDFMKAPARAALYTVLGSSLTTCARHAERAGLRVVTMIDEKRPGVGLAGARLNSLIDRLGDGEFEVIVANAGAGRVVTIAAVPAKGTPIRCAVYLRYATTCKAPYSLGDQWGVCEAYAAERGWETVTVYKDNAVSGMKRSRPSLDVLMVEAQQGAFDVVLVEDLDRLSRDGSHIQQLLEELDTLGIAVHTVGGGAVTAVEASLSIRPPKGQLITRPQRPSSKVRDVTPLENGHRNGKKRHPARGTMVRRVYTAYAAGLSPLAIAQALADANRGGAS